MATLPPNTSQSNAALARQARETFVSHAVQTLDELAAAVRTQLTEDLDKATNARDAQDTRDTWLAFQKGEALWVSGVAAA